MDWWRRPLGALVSGRRVIVAGGPAAAWTSLVAALRDLGATDVLVVATEGTRCRAAARGDRRGRRRAGRRHRRDGPVARRRSTSSPRRRRRSSMPSRRSTPTVRPWCSARSSPRPPSSSADRSSPTADPSGWRSRTRRSSTRCSTGPGCTRASSTVVPVGEAAQAWRALDHGAGTVWAADARDGYHGGGARTRWVTDDDEAAAARRTSRRGVTPCESCRSSRASPRRCTASCSPTASSPCGPSSW